MNAIERITAWAPETLALSENPQTILQYTQPLLHNPLFLESVAAHRVRQIKFGDTSPLSGYFEPYSFVDNSVDLTPVLRNQRTQTDNEFEAILARTEHRLLEVCAAHWLYTAFEQSGYPPLTVGHKIENHWYYDPKKSCRGMFLKLDGPFKKISIMQLDGGDSMGLYKYDQSYRHEHIKDFFYTHMANDGWIHTRVGNYPSHSRIENHNNLFEYWLLITDAEFNILDIADIRNKSIPAQFNYFQNIK